MLIKWSSISGNRIGVLFIINRYPNFIRGNIIWSPIGVDKYPRHIKLIDFGGIFVWINIQSIRGNNIQDIHIKLIEFGVLSMLIE